MSYDVDDRLIRALLGGTRRSPLDGLHDNGDEWMLGTFGILKRRASYSDGWVHNLRPESRFYKRWFEFPEIHARGWAIIFRIFDPIGEPKQEYESFPGWVQPGNEEAADRWIAFLNDQIKARLREAADKQATRGKGTP